MYRSQWSAAQSLYREQGKEQRPIMRSELEQDTWTWYLVSSLSPLLTEKSPLQLGPTIQEA